VWRVFGDAPLEQLANPLLTPNRRKPLVFSGLCRSYCTISLPGGRIINSRLWSCRLIVIPYFHVNVQGQPLWRPMERTLSIFLTVFSCDVFAGLHPRWTVALAHGVVAVLMLYAYATSSRSDAAAGYLQTRPVSWWVMDLVHSVAVVVPLWESSSEVPAGPGLALEFTCR